MRYLAHVDVRSCRMHGFLYNPLLFRYHLENWCLKALNERAPGGCRIRLKEGGEGDLKNDRIAKGLDSDFFFSLLPPKCASPRHSGGEPADLSHTGAPNATRCDRPSSSRACQSPASLPATRQSPQRKNAGRLRRCYPPAGKSFDSSQHASK